MIASWVFKPSRFSTLAVRTAREDDRRWSALDLGNPQIALAAEDCAEGAQQFSHTSKAKRCVRASWRELLGAETVKGKLFIGIVLGSASYATLAMAQDTRVLPEVTVTAAKPKATQRQNATQNARGHRRAARSARPANAPQGQSSPQQSASQPYSSDNSGPSGFTPSSAEVGPLKRRALLNTPLAITVMDKTFIENRGATSLPDLLKYIPSAQMEARGGPDVGRPQTRGMQGNVVSNSHLDGMNIVATTAQPIELYDRVEVISGLTGAFYGPASPAGMFNFIQKRPTDTFFNRITGSWMTDSILMAHGDFGGTVGADKNFGYRINLLKEKGDGFVKGSTLDRDLVSGAFDLHLSDKTVVELNVSHYNFKKYGYPAGFGYGNTIRLPDAPDPTRAGFGQTFGGSELETTTYSGRIKHEFNENWSFTGGMLQQTADRMFSSVSNTMLDNAGNYRTTWSPSTAAGRFQVLSNTANLNGTVFTGDIKHELVIGTTGYTWDIYSALSPSGSAIPIGIANIANPMQWPAPAGIAQDGLRYKSSSNWQQVAIIGDTITFNPYWSAMLVGSYNWIETKNYNKASMLQPNGYEANGFSPTVAIMFKPVSNITTYVAYANSLEQGGTAPVKTANEGQTLAPYRSKQYEAGVKANFGKINATFAAFHLERPFAFTGPDNVYKVQGMQENKGVEFGLSGEVFRNFNVFGGLTLLDPRLKDTGVAATSNTKVVGVPDTQANLLMEYFVERFPGLVFSANVHHTGQRAGNNINSFMVKGFTTVDLGVRYTMVLPDKNTATFRVFANNITNERYWLSIFPGSINGVVGSNTAFLGSPREVRVSASVTF